MGDHLVRDRIVYLPQYPKHPIESSKLHPSCEMVHLVWSAPPYGAQMRTQMRVASRFLDDVDERERVRPLITNHDSNGSVWRFVHPWHTMWTQLWCSQRLPSIVHSRVVHSPRITRLGGVLVPVLDPADFALYPW
jgi:hypothetical protein